MALYIQLKKMNQGTKMCFLLLYIEFVFYTDFDDYFFMFLIKYMYDRVKMWLLVFNCIVIMIT
jgi:hypothetical protein